MKIVRASLAVCILLCAAVLCLPEKAYAGPEDDMAFCDQQYQLQRMDCGLSPDPFCSLNASNTHYMCMSSIPASPDFCSAARARAYNCALQFDPLTDFINYSECTTLSGVQFCE